MTKQFFRRSASLLALAVLAACGSEGGSEVAGDSSAAAPADSGAMADMPGMGGMAGMAGMGAMDTTAMQQMHSQMEAMAAGDSAQMQGMMTQHRQMAANMLAQMNREMQGMNASAEWNETVEAVRQDLARMPEMTPEEFKTFLPEHRDRMNKLMEMHRSMMASM